jgi:hypothetical protein
VALGHIKPLQRTTKPQQKSCPNLTLLLQDSSQKSDYATFENIGLYRLEKSRVGWSLPFQKAE